MCTLLITGDVIVTTTEPIVPMTAVSRPKETFYTKDVHLNHMDQAINLVVHRKMGDKFNDKERMF